MKQKESERLEQEVLKEAVRSGYKLNEVTRYYHKINDDYLIKHADTFKYSPEQYAIDKSKVIAEYANRYFNIVNDKIIELYNKLM